jgi:hypothetical protein
MRSAQSIADLLDYIVDEQAGDHPRRVDVETLKQSAQKLRQQNENLTIAISMLTDISLECTAYEAGVRPAAVFSRIRNGAEGALQSIMTDADPVRDVWRPVDENTPRDRKILGVRTNWAGEPEVVPLTWDPDRYAKKPHPYFRDQLPRVDDQRKRQPYLWREYPTPPLEGV